MPHNRRMMIATKKTKSHAQALLGMAKDEAKIADAVEAGAHRPPPLDIALGRSLPQEAVSRCTSDNSHPSMLSAPLPPKSLYYDDEELSSDSSIDDEFLNYLSGDIPPPVPIHPSVVAMVPASAGSETNRVSVEASMKQSTAGLGDASRRTMLVADMPADTVPADRAGLPSQAQALLDTAEAADVDSGARRPSPRGDGIVRSLPQEEAGRRTSVDPQPSTSSATLPPKSRCPWNPVPSALAAPHAQYADIPPRPSAPPLELLMEDGFFDGPTGDRPTTNTPPPGDEGHARMTPLAEASVVMMPVCEAVRTAGPTPAQDEEDNNALAGWTVKCGKFMMIGVVSLVLVLVALGTLIGVVVMLAKQDDPVTTSTSSTALVTSTTSAAILTSTASTAITTSASSASSTTTPEMITSEPPAVSSSWKQQGPAIVGNADYDELGRAVALSADARTLVVGAPGDDYNTDRKGYVKVYHDDEDSEIHRKQLGQTIFGDATGDRFGRSVDITAEGNNIVLGAPGHFNNTDRPGYVRVYSLVSNDEAGDDTWSQIGQDIIGEANGNLFGYSVSISENGETIAIGAYYGGNSYYSGYAKIYHLEDDGKSWGQIGEDIASANNYFEILVSLSADGSTIAIGAPFNDDNGNASGQVMVYRINSEGSSWEQLVQSIHGDNAGDYFGAAVNLSPDGNTLAIGSPGYWEDDDRPGYVRVFSLESIGSWNQIGQDIIGEANGDEFGCSVSLSDDGKTLAVGARDADVNGAFSGRVKVYQMDDSVSGWMQLGNDIDGKASYDQSGWSVSLSADGNTVAIGSSNNDHNGYDSGLVRVFVLE